MEAHPDSRQLAPGHIPALDGLRGVAIALVLVHNVGAGEAPSRPRALDLLEAVTHVGWVGVSLFFVLSGFLITGILLDTRDAPRPFRSFYVRRALRIFPLYYAVLAVRFAILPLFVPELADHGAAPYYLAYLSNWSTLWGGEAAGLPHMWSLAVEEQFYLLWPLAVLLLGRVSLARLCVVVALASVAFRGGVLLLGWSPAWAYQTTIARADALVLGALVALAVRDARWTAAATRLVPWLMAGSALALALVGAGTHGLSRTEPWVQVVGYSAFGVLFSVLIFAVAQNSRASAGAGTTWPGFRSALERPSLRALGRYSYGIYVFHMPLHLALYPRAMSMIHQGGAGRRIALLCAYVGVVSLASFALAVVSYHLFEERFLALKDTFAPRGITGGPGRA